MNFGVFRATRGNKNASKKNCLAVPEELYDAPFSKIIACMDPDYLEDAVCHAFEEILPYRTADEFKEFKLFESWTNLFIEHLDEVMDILTSIEDYKKIIVSYPSVTAEVYSYLLETYLIKDEDVNGMSITDDVLIPMSDLEKYQNFSFPFIRERAIEILDAAEDYHKVWDILQVYEQYFDIPMDYFEPYLKEQLEIILEDFSERDLDYYKYGAYVFDSDDYQLLKDWFMDAKAYELFMDNLPALLAKSGIELYSLLIILLGPVHEVIKFHDCCLQFLKAEE